MQQPDMPANETPEQLRERGDRLMLAGEADASEACYAEAARREANQAASQAAPVVAATPVITATPVVATPVVAGTPVVVAGTVVPSTVGASTQPVAATPMFLQDVKRDNSFLSVTSIDSSLVVTRVCVAVGSLVQGLCFELSDGTRNGYFLKEAPAGDVEEGFAEEVPRKDSATSSQLWEVKFLSADELKDDAALLSRGGQWHQLATADDPVVKVHGQNTTSGQQLPCANIHFTMRSGRVLHFEGTQQPGSECLVHFEFVPETLHMRFFGLEITETGVVGLRGADMTDMSRLCLMRDHALLTEGSPSELRWRRLILSDRFNICVAGVTFLNSLFLILVLAQVVGTGYFAGSRNKDPEAEEGSDDMVMMLRTVLLAFFVLEHGLKLYAFQSIIKRLDPAQKAINIIGLGRYPRNGFYGTVAFIALHLRLVGSVSFDPWILTLGKSIDSGFFILRLLKRKGVF